jgi:hypothetical protein
MIKAFNRAQINKVSHKGTPMVITKETREDMAQALGQTTVSEKTAKDILLICKHDLTAREALKMRGIDNPNPDTITDLKRKSERYLLSSPEMQKLAHNVHKRAMQGKPIVGKYKKDGKDCENVMLPDYKHAMAAADSVMIRTDPVKQQASGGTVNLFIDKVQVNQFQAQDMGHVIDGDIVPEAISNENNDLPD